MSDDPTQFDAAPALDAKPKDASPSAPPNEARRSVPESPDHAAAARDEAAAAPGAERARGPRRTRFPGRNMASRTAKGCVERSPASGASADGAVAAIPNAALGAPDPAAGDTQASGTIPAWAAQGQRAHSRANTQKTKGPTGSQRSRKTHTAQGVGLDATEHQRRPRGRANGAAGALDRSKERAAADSSFADVLSGSFDAVDAPTHNSAERAPEQSANKRVLRPDPEQPKLHKILAQSGMGSRLEMEQLILEGRISVNNEPAHTGQRIQFGDQIRINGKPLRYRIAPPPTRVIAYHKPAGEVVTHDDPQNRPTVFRALPRLQQGKWQSVGRLDLNTEGLLLFSNSGDLVNRLTHPRFGLEREYAVRVLGALDEQARQRLLNGIELGDGPAQLTSISQGGGEGANCWYRVTIAEGRYREVRRLFEALGHAVSRLIRIRYGKIVLPRGLRRGEWLELDASTVSQLGAVVGLSEASTGRGDHDGRSKPRFSDKSASRGPVRDASAASGFRAAAQRPPRRPSRARDERGSKMEDRIARALQNSVNAMSGPAGPAGATLGARNTKNYSGAGVGGAYPSDGAGPRRGPNGAGGRKNFGASAGRGGNGVGRYAAQPRAAAGGAKTQGGAVGPSNQPDPMRTSLGYLGANDGNARTRRTRPAGQGGPRSGGRLGPGRYS